MQRHDQLENLINGENIVKFIKSARIRWFGHLMNNLRMPKVTFQKRIGSKRRRERLQKRWKQVVQEDLTRSVVRNWKQK